MFLIRRMDKSWYIKTKDHRLGTKGVNCDMLDNMNESKKDNYRLKKNPDTLKKYILYDSI